MRDPHFVRDVTAVLEETALPPEALTLEITESMLMADRDTGLRQLHQLRHAGVHLALDDFGTGYSSLSYLKHLPVGDLKIDKSFIYGLRAEQAADAMWPRAVIGLAQMLRLTVTAEGIEEPA